MSDTTPDANPQEMPTSPPPSTDEGPIGAPDANLTGRICGGRTPAGPCQRPRGDGTSHPGWGRCVAHAGQTPHGRARALADAILATVPAPADPFGPTDPHRLDQIRALVDDHNQPLPDTPMGDR